MWVTSHVTIFSDICLLLTLGQGGTINFPLFGRIVNPKDVYSLTFKLWVSPKMAKGPLQMWEALRWGTNPSLSGWTPSPHTHPDKPEPLPAAVRGMAARGLLQFFLILKAMHGWSYGLLKSAEALSRFSWGIQKNPLYRYLEFCLISFFNARTGTQPSLYAR